LNKDTTQRESTEKSLLEGKPCAAWITPLTALLLDDDPVVALRFTTGYQLFKPPA
jgi:hypothetical protein